MRCPRCRREIAFEAVSHECGWRVSGIDGGKLPGTGVQHPVERVPVERVEVHMAKIKEILGSTVSVHKRLSSEERHEGVKLSPEEVEFRRELEAKKRSRLERLRKTVESV
jgi:hypothetical protein